MSFKNPAGFSFQGNHSHPLLKKLKAFSSFGIVYLSISSRTHCMESTCRGRCPHRPVRKAAERPTGGCGHPPLREKPPGVVVGAAFMAARGAVAISASLPLNAAAARAGIHPAPTRNRGRGRRGGLHGRPWGSRDFRQSSAERSCGAGGDKPRPYAKTRSVVVGARIARPTQPRGRLGDPPLQVQRTKNARRHEAAGRGGFLTHPGRSRNRARCS